jgi:UDP-N-acetylmuramyl pentapeptide phosphotransferase/UDP-N-acetylglucosamine-1-phosphate transferase
VKASQYAIAPLAFVFTFLLTPLIIKLTKKHRLVDQPGGRKIHKYEKPSLGGVAILLGFFGSLLMTLPSKDLNDSLYVMAGILIVTIVGIRDDLLSLKPYYKIIGQLMAASIIIVFADIRITSFHGILGINQIPYVLSVLITLFTIIVITNSFNLIDGLDGLASILALIALFALGVWYDQTGNTLHATLLISLFGAVSAFLIYNWEPSRIFMGDTGSLMIGFIIAIFSINFIQKNDLLEITHPFYFHNPVTIAVCITGVPLFDTLRIFVVRVLKKRSPFSADKNHLHHLLLRLGISHSKVCCIMGTASIFLISVAVFSRSLEDQLTLWLIVLLLLMASFVLKRNMISLKKKMLIYFYRKEQTPDQKSVTSG